VSGELFFQTEVVVNASAESACSMGDDDEEPLDITGPVGCKQLVPHILI